MFVIPPKKHSANTLAVALEILSGKPATALCCWCLNDVDPHETKPVRRPAGGGWCVRCPYTGDDVLVVGDLSTYDACTIAPIPYPAIDIPTAVRPETYA